MIDQLGLPDFSIRIGLVCLPIPPPHII